MLLAEDIKALELQQRYKEAGSEIDICVFEIQNADGSEYEISKAAARKAMYEFIKRLFNNPYRNPPVEDDDLSELKNANPDGTYLTFDEFLGDSYSDTWTIDQTKGLIYALLCPPHGVNTPNPNLFLNEFLRDILLINGIDNTDHLTIYKWSDDWSSYFNDGKEWWGTFYWTVLDRKFNRIVVIGASTTD